MLKERTIVNDINRIYPRSRLLISWVIIDGTSGGLCGLIARESMILRSSRDFVWTQRDCLLDSMVDVKLFMCSASMIGYMDLHVGFGDRSPIDKCWLWHIVNGWRFSWIMRMLGLSPSIGQCKFDSYPFINRRGWTWTSRNTVFAYKLVCGKHWDLPHILRLSSNVQYRLSQMILGDKWTIIEKILRSSHRQFIWSPVPS